MWRKTINYFQRFAQHRQYRLLLNKNSQAEDIFLVSYPKSGNTWLRFLIANTVKIHYKIEREVNFFTIHDFVPDVHKNGNASMNVSPTGILGNPEIPRIIKSHGSYNPYYQRVILLVRDPRDVLISYFYYQKRYGIISEDCQISDFIRHPKYGAKAWSIHTESWVKTIKVGQIVQIFRYEDFLKSTQSELARLMDLIGLKVEEGTLEKAINLSSKENMKITEKKHGSTFLIKTQKTPFVRNGIATGGKELSDTDRQFVEDVTRNIAHIIGYDYRLDAS